MDEADPLATLVAPTLERLMRRPGVHAAAFAPDGGRSPIVRSMRDEAAAQLASRFDITPRAARSAHIVAHLPRAYVAVAAVEEDGSIWVLFDDSTAPAGELAALDEAVDALRADLDAWLGPAEGIA